jgi:hypothetical protein
VDVRNQPTCRRNRASRCNCKSGEERNRYGKRCLPEAEMLDRTVGINPEWRRRLPTTSMHGSSRVTGVLLDAVGSCSKCMIAFSIVSGL